MHEACRRKATSSHYAWSLRDKCLPPALTLTLQLGEMAVEYISIFECFLLPTRESQEWPGSPSKEPGMTTKTNQSTNPTSNENKNRSQLPRERSLSPETPKIGVKLSIPRLAQQHTPVVLVSGGRSRRITVLRPVWVM